MQNYAHLKKMRDVTLQYKTFQGQVCKHILLKTKRYENIEIYKHLPPKRRMKISLNSPSSLTEHIYFLVRSKSSLFFGLNCLISDIRTVSVMEFDTKSTEACVNFIFSKSVNTLKYFNNITIQIY